MSKVYVNPLPVRIWHWANAILFLVLIVTGVQIRYLGSIDLMSFRTAVVVHNWVAFALIGNFFIWLLFYLFSDKNTRLSPRVQPAEAGARELRARRSTTAGGCSRASAARTGSTRTTSSTRCSARSTRS